MNALASWYLPLSLYVMVPLSRSVSQLVTNTFASLLDRSPLSRLAKSLSEVTLLLNAWLISLLKPNSVTVPFCV